MAEDPIHQPQPEREAAHAQRCCCCHPQIPNPTFEHECVSDHGERAHDGMLDLLPFLREDSDHVVFRRFRNLHLLHLLALQHQLKHCVEQLQRYHGRVYREPLLKVLDEVGPLLKRYGLFGVSPNKIFCHRMR